MNKVVSFRLADDQNVVALCDDGHLWTVNYWEFVRGRAAWKKITPVLESPKPESELKPALLDLFEAKKDVQELVQELEKYSRYCAFDCHDEGLNHNCTTHELLGKHNGWRHNPNE